MTVDVEQLCIVIGRAVDEAYPFHRWHVGALAPSDQDEKWTVVAALEALRAELGETAAWESVEHAVRAAALQYWAARFEADADPERLRLEAKLGQVTAEWNTFVARLGWMQTRGYSIRLRQLVAAYIERLPAGFFEAYCAEEAEKAVGRDEVHS